VITNTLHVSATWPSSGLFKYIKKAYFIVSLNLAFQISFKILCTKPYNAPFVPKHAACS
jgi:hypothetical protein